MRSMALRNDRQVWDSAVPNTGHLRQRPIALVKKPCASREDTFSGKRYQTDLEEVSRLRCENESLHQERDILKKVAMAQHQECFTVKVMGHVLNHINGKRGYATIQTQQGSGARPFHSA
jgi:hypothetical protein